MEILLRNVNKSYDVKLPLKSRHVNICMTKYIFMLSLRRSPIPSFCSFSQCSHLACDDDRVSQCDGIKTLIHKSFKEKLSPFSLNQKASARFRTRGQNYLLKNMAFSPDQYFKLLITKNGNLYVNVALLWCCQTFWNTVGMVLHLYTVIIALK